MIMIMRDVKIVTSRTGILAKVSVMKTPPPIKWFRPEMFAPSEDTNFYIMWEFSPE